MFSSPILFKEVPNLLFLVSKLYSQFPNCVTKRNLPLFFSKTGRLCSNFQIAVSKSWAGRNSFGHKNFIWEEIYSISWKRKSSKHSKLADSILSVLEFQSYFQITFHVTSNWSMINWRPLMWEVILWKDALPWRTLMKYICYCFLLWRSFQVYFRASHKPEKGSPLMLLRMMHWINPYGLCLRALMWVDREVSNFPVLKDLNCQCIDIEETSSV